MLRFQHLVYGILNFALGVSAPAWAEVQNGISLTASTVYPGDDGSFSASSISGPNASGSGAKSYTFSGLIKYRINVGDGRYAGVTGVDRYGVAIDAFEFLQSFVSPLFHIPISSSTTCPGTTTYNWIGIRYRNKNITRGPQDPTASNFYAGGQIVYNAGAPHPLTGTNYFDLAGPTSQAATYALDANGPACSSGTFKTSSVTALDPAPFDAYGTASFGTNAFQYISSGGNPVMMLGTTSGVLNAGSFSALNKNIYSGIYTSFDWPGTQTRYKVFLEPDSAGTTFTIRQSTSDSDPTLKTLLGTLACTTINSPQSGFCSGTLTLNGVGGSGKAVCMISSTGQPILACSAQRPDVNTVPVSILSSVPAQTILAVTLSTPVVQVTSAGDSATVTATLQNLGGRAISSLANPGGGLDLAAPFSNSGAYAGTGGTCTSSLAAFASCNVTITYNPSALGTHLQTFRVAYNNGTSTVNATANLIGTAGLSSLAVDQGRSKFGPHAAQTFTVTATYSNGSTQDVSSAVSWSSSDTSVATITSSGVANFIKLGTSTLTATLGSSSTTVSSTVQNPGGYATVWGQADSDHVETAGLGGMSLPQAMTVAGGRIYVADSYNNRLLVWSSIPTTDGAPSSFALGQPDMSSVRFNNGGIDANRFAAPHGICSNGTKLALVDTSNYRVLIWNVLPTSVSNLPDVVLGQTNMTSRSSGVSSSLFAGPYGCSMSATKLAVAEYNNARVLLWNSIPTTNKQPADIVLGQPDMTTSTRVVSSSRTSGPLSVFTDGTRVAVSDYLGHRALIWNTFPTASGQPANIVLGQSDFTSSFCNADDPSPPPSAQTLCAPKGISSDGTRLFISDYNNGRLLIWNTFPTVTSKAADVVVGQPDMTSAVTAASSTYTYSPADSQVSGGKLFLLDSLASRLMVYNSIPSVNFQAADNVLGTASMTSVRSNSINLVNPSNQRIAAPYGLHFDGSKLWAADTFNSRVLMWNGIPTSVSQAPDLVLGQSSYTTRSSATTASAMSTPFATFSDGRKLFVADGTHRVLIWDTIPTANFQAANWVVGQTSMTGASANGGGSAAAGTLFSPRSVFSDGKRLFVSDFSNNRVLIWNAIPSSNGKTADVVLGQASMTTQTSGTSDTQFYGPMGVYATGRKLFVADMLNNRVLAWNSIPTANGQAADYVIGQPDFTTGSVGSTTNQSLNGPIGIASDGNRLFVTSSGLSRIMVWNSLPTVTNQAADAQYGQIAFSNGIINYGSSGSASAPTGMFLSYPTGVTTDGLYAFVTDTYNNRVLTFVPGGSYAASLAITGTNNYSTVATNTTTDQTFTVANSGLALARNLGAGSPSLAAPFYYKGGTYPGTGGTCGTELRGGTSCTVVVSLVPTAAGSPSATLAIAYTDGNGASTNATLSLSGSVTTSLLTASASPGYAFGSTPGNATITLTNSGGTKATGLWSGTPALAAPFRFYGGTFPGTGGTCTTQLAGQSSCTIVLNFAPTGSGSFSDTVRLSYTDGGGTPRTLSFGVTGSY